MVSLTIWLLPDISISFWAAVLASVVVSLINFLVNLLVPAYNKK